jgi:pimeloyl-ACP methyl ester carboxylesterase
MPYAEVNGQRLYYEDTGGSGPVVAFSHGLFMDHSMFAAQVAALKDRYRCVSWDERGHGRTAGEQLEPFSYYDSADDLAGLLAHLGIEQAVLGGMSQGGYLSLRCALTHPKLVRALVLIDTQAMPEDPAKLPGYRQMVDMWSANGLPDVIADTLEQIILGNGWAGATAWKDKWRGWNPVNLRQCFHTLISRDDISTRLKEIGIPALVIHGDLDMAIAVDHARAMAEGLKRSELVLIKGGGHAANLTHPDQVNPKIEAFLAALR